MSTHKTTIAPPPKEPWEKFGLTKEEWEEVVEVFRMLSEWDRELRYRKVNSGKETRKDKNTL